MIPRLLDRFFQASDVDPGIRTVEIEARCWCGHSDRPYIPPRAGIAAALVVIPPPSCRLLLAYRDEGIFWGIHDFKPAELRNGATYGCSAVIMTKWEIAGLPTTGPLPAAAAPVAAPPAS